MFFRDPSPLLNDRMIHNMSTRTPKNKSVSFSNYLRVFLLFTCPVCLCYTIHKPRINRKGNYYVDHKRVPVYRPAADGSKEFVGLVAEEACFIGAMFSMENIETTRTVIRVK